MSVDAEIVEAPAPVEVEDREGGPGVAEAKVWPSGVRRDATLDFVVAVRCFGYYGGATSVWVLVGVVDQGD